MATNQLAVIARRAYGLPAEHAGDGGAPRRRRGRRRAVGGRAGRGAGRGGQWDEKQTGRGRGVRKAGRFRVTSKGRARTELVGRRSASDGGRRSDEGREVGYGSASASRGQTGLAVQRGQTRRRRERRRRGRAARR